MSSKKTWNYRPEEPLTFSPVYSWPPKVLVLLKWYFKPWVTLSPLSVQFASALLFWFFLRPELAQMKSLEWGWISKIYLTNATLLIIVAGGLHTWFYIWKKQGTTLRFHAQELKRDSRRFTFDDQVKDNICWSLGYGVLFWSLWEITYFWSLANNWLPTLDWGHNLGWFLAITLLIPTWISFHFYWVHRALHWPLLYRFAHNIHHRNVNTGPWSGLSMHPFELTIYYSSILVCTLVPMHPIHILIMLHILGYGPAMAHSGFDGIQIRGKNRFPLGDFFHQLHHRYFECNYGTPEIPFARWFGTYHDGSEEWKIKLLEKRRSK